MKKGLALAMALMMAAVTLGGAMAAEGAINVISREDGSGTRGAFVELMGIEQKNESGEKVDMTTDEADITNSTSVMMTSVAGNPNAIGYISLGSLNETVKALDIDGAAATVENIKNGSYKIARPFNVATRADVTEPAKAFLDYILSAEGQAVVEANGYIASVEDAQPYAGSGVAGKVVVAGSSSVTPVMEKLKEAYLAVNPNAEIEVQQSDSSAGMNSLKDGVCDIGMASRALKDSELEAGLTPTVIAMDGIAVIVSPDNGCAGMTSDQVRAIYMGEIKDWAEVQ
ncbi:MAG: substrate-binding domain-containing protein [Clostridiales bacterium]|nr:substrate-binding domain-containing protein [Clostridiales bacterium]MDO4351143.1 substrate-binding domain-containing protein [Eubacteriales bacterium]MDY4007756.1 substrate-binding domain-containing protein [Candidatus Limiplasma sp.]